MFNANVLLMGGDMTSKVMVPIVREPEGGYTANFLGKQVKISEEGLPDLKKQIRQHCYLPYVCSKDEVVKLSRDQEYVEKVFEDLEVEMVKDWLSLIPTKAPDAKVIIHPGNDDKFVLDDVLRKSPNIVFAEESAVHFDDLHEAACVGWSNPTPWHSPRECTEEQSPLKHRASAFTFPPTIPPLIWLRNSTRVSGRSTKEGDLHSFLWGRHRFEKLSRNINPSLGFMATFTKAPE